MEIPIKLLGRVELDPMRIPTATSMSQTNEEQFTQLLEETVVDDAVPEQIESAPREQAPSDELEQPPEEVGPEIERRPRHEEDDASLTNNADVHDEPTGSTPSADVTENMRRGEPDRQETAGKGEGSPRASTSHDSEPLIAARLQAAPIQAGQPAIAAQATGQQPLTARAVEPAVRGSATAAELSSSAGKTQRAQASYGTRSAATAQMLEQARDSVFKQIMMKLNDDGGEMRLRLQPPELGELDLRLTVEGGNKMSLAIASDQRDMAALLQRHLDELKQTLQQNGLEITDAEVQTRSEFQRDQERSDSPEGGAADGNAPAEETAAIQQPRGYITAQGLDFWA